MRRNSGEWTVKMLTDVQARIGTEAEYQRGLVWSDNAQRLLIDSLLRGFDLPKIYLNKLPDGSEMLYEVVDGKQRLNAIWRFMNGDLRLSRNADVEGLGSLGRKNWGELTKQAQDRLQFAKVTVSELEEATPDEVKELFLRLQAGDTLRAAEKRNAITGPVGTYVAGTLAKLPVFPALGIPDRRMTWRELAAIALELTIVGGPTALKSADLRELYYDQDFDPAGEAAGRTVAALGKLGDIAAVRPGRINTRWGFVDLLLCLQYLERDKIDWTPAQVMAFFIDFEAERKNTATKLSELQEELQALDPSDVDPKIEMPDVEPDMFTYVNAFAREGATKSNVAARSEVMYRRLANYLLVSGESQ